MLNIIIAEILRGRYAQLFNQYLPTRPHIIETVQLKYLKYVLSATAWHVLSLHRCTYYRHTDMPVYLHRYKLAMRMAFTNGKLSIDNLS